MTTVFMFLVGYAVGAFTVFFMFGLNTPDDDEYEEN